MNRDAHHDIQRVLDGTVSSEEFGEFQQRLRDDPGLFKLYGEYALLDHSLSEEYEQKKIDGLAHVFSPHRVKAGWAWLAAVAAVVVIAAIFLTKKSGPAAESPPAAATARFSEDAVWRAGGNALRFGIPLPLTANATITLSQGQSLLTGDKGSSLLLEGPATLTIVSPKKFLLLEGRAYREALNPKYDFQLATPALLVSEVPPADFGVEVRSNLPDEAHVITGHARVRALAGGNGQILSAGDAARAAGNDEIERFPADTHHFAKSLMAFFDAVPGDFTKTEWTTDFGNPSILPDLIDGENYTIFHKLPVICSTTPVILTTMETVNPATGAFQTDGWAGLSFFSGGKEMLFFGDCYGPEPTWGLDVKQNAPLILPERPLAGARTVTLRYDRRTGDVSLHEGRPPLRTAFCAGKIPPGLIFDHIRLGASSNAALAVRSLKIRVTSPSS